VAEAESSLEAANGDEHAGAADRPCPLAARLALRYDVRIASQRVRALAKNFLKLWPALWTFADIPDVEPTNNAAERGLRAAVIYRKLSLGSRSQQGERTIERLLSVDQTCRLQRRSLYGYLSELLAAKARGDPLPALV
jgi:transposase